MGLEDRDWWREAQKERDRKGARATRSATAATRTSNGLTRGLELGPVGIVAFWLVTMGLLYVAMNHYLKPKPVIVSASGDLVIPRARDGHFYAAGSINGRPVNFLVDTRATLVTVSETFAREAGLSSGIPTVFRTANGDLQGRPKHLLGGYKSFMWHAKADGSQPVFNGVQGQRVFVDIPSQTVLVQTAVDDAGDWQSELYALFKSAIQMT